MTAAETAFADDHTKPDPRRWITLAIIILAAFIVVLDNSILYVAIPTILREFHTTLPSLQWVITGYALTFATLLIIGGRLGDVYGHRRIFIIGAALFGAGSLLASVSQSVPELVLGEAIIEGIGASLDAALDAGDPVRHVPRAGNEAPRSACGARPPARRPRSARWSVASSPPTTPGGGRSASTSSSPRSRSSAHCCSCGAAFRGERTLGIDVPGALLVASGMFLLVFGLSEGGTYGWLLHGRDFSVGRPRDLAVDRSRSR